MSSELFRLLSGLIYMEVCGNRRWVGVPPDARRVVILLLPVAELIHPEFIEPSRDSREYPKFEILNPKQTAAE